MAGPGKGLLAVLAGGEKKASAMDEEAGGYDKVTEAQAIIDAQSSGDAEMLAEALESFVRGCMGKPETEEM